MPRPTDISPEREAEWSQTFGRYLHEGAPELTRWVVARAYEVFCASAWVVDELDRLGVPQLEIVEVAREMRAMLARTSDPWPAAAALVERYSGQRVAREQGLGARPVPLTRVISGLRWRLLITSILLAMVSFMWISSLSRLSQANDPIRQLEATKSPTMPSPLAPVPSPPGAQP